MGRGGGNSKLICLTVQHICTVYPKGKKLHTANVVLLCFVAIMKDDVLGREGGAPIVLR